MIKYLGKIFLCALSVLIGSMVGGMVTTLLKLEQPDIPGQVDMRLLALYTFVGGMVLSIALAELSQWLRGSCRWRFAAAAWFAFAWLGINNTIEACIFTTIGGGPSMVVTMLCPCLFVTGTVVPLFVGREPEASFSNNFCQFFAGRTAAQWAVRLLAAIIAFPLIYFFFGVPVGLMVGESYRNQAFGLQMPSLSVVIGVQCVRSFISLFAAVPILAAWQGSRRRFAWTFGLCLFVVSGLYGLIQAYWMPWTLRSVHTIELLLDSLAYGWILALVFLPARSARKSLSVEKVASGAF